MLQGCIKKKVWKATSVIPQLGEHHLEGSVPLLLLWLMNLREPLWGTAGWFHWRGRWVSCAGVQSK